MLILSQRRDQEIVINDDIFVRVLEIRGNRVQLGIEAPKDLTIMRRELARADTAVARVSQQPKVEAEPQVGPLLPAVQDIRTAVAEEAARAGATISDCYEDGRRLFMRAKLPERAEVRHEDFIQSGVAVMTTGKEIQVHKYTLRQVCRNGAIAPVEEGAYSISRVAFDATAEAIAEVIFRLRDAVYACLEADVLSEAVEQLRQAAERPANPQRHLRASKFGTLLPRRMRREIVRRFKRDQDRTLYGLTNAITSVARDERDPELRWRLEELGGAIPSIVPPSAKPVGDAAEPANAVA